MPGENPCPVDECSFEGTVAAVSDHIRTTKNATHSWVALGYDHEEDFKVTQHVECADSHERRGREAADTGGFDTAIEHFETAHYHCDRARTIGDDHGIEFEKRCRELLREIERVERDRVRHDIVDRIDTAETYIEEGDAELIAGSRDSAAKSYDAAIEILERARTETEENLQEQRTRIETLLERSRSRRESVGKLDDYREVLEAVREAREHRDLGDTRFKESDYEAALEKYQVALDAYERVSAALEKFTFDGRSEGDDTCEVCGRTLKMEPELIQLENGVHRTVCLGCTHFAPNGVLPTPTEVETEVQYITENAESIDTGDYGLDWTSKSDISEHSDEEYDDTPVDEQQMLLELVGVYQSVGGVPSAADLDERTEFGYRQYRIQFGTIEDALREAGFDV